MEESKSIGQMVEEGKVKALRFLALTVGLIVYAGMIGYTGVHNFSLMTKGVPEEMMVPAIIGILAIELTAVALPIALHYWFFDQKQRLVGFMFYAVDFAVMFLNVVISFTLTEGGTLPQWQAIWLSYMVPATPIVMGLGWTILLMLDPHSEELATKETLRVGMLKTKWQAALNEAHSNADVNLRALQAGQSALHSIAAATFGDAAGPLVISGQARNVGQAYQADVQGMPEPTSGITLMDDELTSPRGIIGAWMMGAQPVTDAQRQVVDQYNKWADGNGNPTTARQPVQGPSGSSKSSH